VEFRVFGSLRKRGRAEALERTRWFKAEIVDGGAALMWDERVGDDQREPVVFTGPNTLFLPKTSEHVFQFETAEGPTEVVLEADAKCEAQPSGQRRCEAQPSKMCLVCCLTWCDAHVGAYGQTTEAPVLICTQCAKGWKRAGLPLPCSDHRRCSATGELVGILTPTDGECERCAENGLFGGGARNPHICHPFLDPSKPEEPCPLCGRHTQHSDLGPAGQEGRRGAGGPPQRLYSDGHAPLPSSALEEEPETMNWSSQEQAAIMETAWQGVQKERDERAARGGALQSICEQGTHG